MFDLAKTLGIYTDERYDRIKKAIGSFRVEGDFYLVPARVRLETEAEAVGQRYHGSPDVKVTPNCAGIDDYITLLKIDDCTNVNELIEMMTEWNVTPEQIKSGADIFARLERKEVNKQLAKRRPDAMMNTLLLSKEDGELWDIFNRWGVTSVTRTLIYVLFGVEIVSSCPRGAYRETLARLPATDFGIKDVRHAEALIDMLLDIKQKITKENLGNLRAFMATHGKALHDRTPKLPSLKFLLNCD